jgi:hypothetical protein
MIKDFKFLTIKSKYPLAADLPRIISRKRERMGPLSSHPLIARFKFSPHNIPNGTLVPSWSNKRNTKIF